MKFRGMRVDNGEWIEGNLLIHESTKTVEVAKSTGVKDSGVPWEIYRYEVHPESVGMSTLQKDKNGVEIFGSIPVGGKISKGGDKLRYFNGLKKDIEEFYNLIWLKDSCEFRAKKIGEDDTWQLPFMFKDMEVIGKQIKED